MAQAVRRSDGPVLIGEGFVLTEAVIGRIREAGIGSIWVEGNPLGPEGDVGNLRVLSEKLPFLFRRQKDNVFMTTLCTVLSQHFGRRLAEQQALEDAAIEAAKNGEVDRRDAARSPGNGAGNGK